MDGWKRKTPDNFLFAVKFPRSIVHCGKDARPDPARVVSLEHTARDRDKFLEVIGRLEKRLGPLLLQFPYFKATDFTDAELFFERLDRFMESLPKNFRYAVEIRNRHWLTEDFAGLCRRHNAAIALVDHAWMPHGDEVEKLFNPVTTDFCYVRLIGDRAGIEKLTQTWDQEVIDQTPSLRRWAELLSRMVNRKIASFAYINNHYAGHAPATARKLAELLDKIMGRK